MGCGRPRGGHGDVYWRPRLFERRFLNVRQAEGGGTARERARALIGEIRRAHEYAPDSDTQRGIDAILAAARANLRP